MKIIIKKTKNQEWDVVSDLLNNESGNVTGTELRDGAVYYNANFPIYGGLFLAIPETVVTIVE